MNVSKFLPVLLVLSAPALAANPPTACYIYVQGDCHGLVPQKAWFADNYNGSPLNNGVCIHRAREYAAYCGLRNAGDAVYAAFNIGPVTSSAQLFQPGNGPGTGTAATTNYGLNWVPLVESPTEDVTLRVR